MTAHDQIKQAADMIRSVIATKSKPDQIIWQAILDLIDRSDCGRRAAQSEINIPVPQGQDLLTEALSGDFDGVIMKVFEMVNIVFRSVGKASVDPYSRGLVSRSARLMFEPNVGSS